MVCGMLHTGAPTLGFFPTAATNSVGFTRFHSVPMVIPASVVVRIMSSAEFDYIAGALIVYVHCFGITKVCSRSIGFTKR